MSDYDVILLVEQALSATDARQVTSLHEGLDDPVTYHVLMPLEDAAARIEAALGTMSGNELNPGAALTLNQIDFEAVREESQEQSQDALSATLAALHEAGATASGEVIEGSPIDALAAKASEVDAREAVILTRPHVVAEFFHLDWASSARRHLGIPVLHLLEHENFDEQAGGGEGASLI